MLVPLIVPVYQEQERGNNNEAYCNPELYEGNSLSVGPYG